MAFKLAHAVLTQAGWPEAKLYRVLESFLKLVAIATVADIVPLTGENRVIVKHGLRGLGDVRNPGCAPCSTRAGFQNRVPDATEVAFRIAPAINASGRMDSAGHAVRMFLTADVEEARTIATELFALNAERQTAERSIVQQILDRVWKRRSPMKTRRWFCGARAGIGEWWGSWPAAWWNGSTGRPSCWASPTGWHRVPAAVFTRFICWKRWKACGSCSQSLAVTPMQPG